MLFFEHFPDLMQIFSSLWDTITAVISAAAASIYLIARHQNKRRIIIGVTLVALGCLGAAAYFVYGIEKAPTRGKLTKVTLGSKDFLESSILAEMVAYHIGKRYPKLKIKRRYGLGDSKFLQSFLRDNDIDLYPEYTGTALTELIGIEPDHAKDKTIHRTKFLNDWFPLSKRTKQMRALELFGFRNNNAMVMRKSRFEELCKLPPDCRKTMTWLAEVSRHVDLRVGSANEFFFRQDGLPSLRKVYNFGLIKFQAVQHEKKYRQLANGQMDAIIGYTTDPQLLEKENLILEDNFNTWHDYYAFPLANVYLIAQLPDLPKCLKPLAKTITEGDMQRLIRDALRAGITSEGLARGRTGKLERLVKKFFEHRVSHMTGGN